MKRFYLALRPHRHILLLSHMRAYTSLLGHILGSHPSICGYYEMHIGYYSWKSLVRQKLIYFRDEPSKPGFEAMFDKVLHNDHGVLTDVLDMPRVSTIFALRHPGKVIPSILRLYSSADPTHEFNSEAFATNYYIERLKELERLASTMKKDFFYLDAEAVRQTPREALDKLGHWLELATPLSEKYELQNKTATDKAGDNSERMGKGEIVKESSEANAFTVSQELIDRASPVYERVRNSLIAGCAEKSLFDS
jgi:hypothetical protein